MFEVDPVLRTRLVTAVRSSVQCGDPEDPLLGNCNSCSAVNKDAADSMLIVTAACSL